MKKKFSVGWGLTNKCNMNCKFCYSQKVRNEIKECDIDEWKSFIDENYKYIDSINYGTGENSILDNFFYFVEYIRKTYPSIKQSLTTNGYISVRVQKNERFLNIYKECIDEIDVSIDFADKEKHSIFRGQVHAYDWAIQTLKLSEKFGKLCTIVFVGMEETLEKENLDGLFKIAKNYNALLRMNIYRPVNKGDEKFILSYKTLKNGLEYIYDKYQIVSLSDVLLGNTFVGDTQVKDNTGINSIRILADGTICPSTYLINTEHRKDKNINNQDLANLYFEEFEDAQVPNECIGCKYEDSCRGGVFDRRILWYNTFAERDPYCPLRNGDELPKEFFRISKTERVSIHDGYLPTLFFKNNEDK